MTIERSLMMCKPETPIFLYTVSRDSSQGGIYRGYPLYGGSVFQHTSSYYSPANAGVSASKLHKKAYYLTEAGSNIYIGTFASVGNSPTTKYITTGQANSILVGPSGNVYASISGYIYNYLFSKEGGASLVYSGSAPAPSAGARMAVDLSGNLYIANTSANALCRVTPAGTVSNTWVTGLSSPYGVAVDSVGNIYVSNGVTTTLRKLSSAGATLANYTVGSGQKNVAIDANDNVYVALVNGSVAKITPAGVVTSPWATTVYGPTHICTDPFGDVYVGCVPTLPNSQAGTVYRIKPNGAASVVDTMLYLYGISVEY